MKEKRKKYTIALISSTQTIFLKGIFSIDKSPFPNFFLFYDERDKCEFNIPWNKILWIKEENDKDD